MCVMLKACNKPKGYSIKVNLIPYFRSSAYTKSALKAWKSLDAWKYFKDGFVDDIYLWHLKDRQTFVMRSKVKHSQKLNDPPLKPWLAVSNDGCVISAHCTCMAGLGEVCSHIGAVLFATIHAVEYIKNKSCTSKPCEWLPPSLTNVPSLEVCQINFSAKKPKLDEKLTDS